MLSNKRFSFDMGGLRGKDKEKDKVRFAIDNVPAAKQQQQATTTPGSNEGKQQPKMLVKRLSLGKLFCSQPSKEKTKQQANQTIAFLDDNDNSDREATFDVSLDFSRLVLLPPGMDTREWLATHAEAFFFNVGSLCEALSDFCCTQSCPTLTGPSSSNQMWTDEKSRKHKYSAARYIDLATTLIQRLIQSEKDFPTKFGNNFPSTFEATVKNIMTQLGRILCHVCHAHWRHVIAISMTTHLTALVRHFIAFVTHYKLVRSDELDLLSNLYKNCASSSPPTAHQRQVTVTPVTQTASPRDIRDAISDNSATSGLGRSPADDSCSSSSSDVSIDRLSNCSLTSAGLLPSHEDAASRRSSDGSGSYGNQKRMAQLRHHGEMTSLAEFRRASATSVDSGHWDTEKHVTRHNMELSLSTVSYLC